MSTVNSAWVFFNSKQLFWKEKNKLFSCYWAAGEGLD